MKFLATEKTLDDRVLSEIKDRLELPDGKFTDEELAKAYSGTLTEGKAQLSLVVRDVLEPIAEFFESIGNRVMQSSSPIAFFVFWLIVCSGCLLAVGVFSGLLRAIFVA